MLKQLWKRTRSTESVDADAPPDALAARLAERWSAGAFESLRRQAAAGAAQAQFHVGQLYERGAGVVQNLADAAHWYRLAAAQGHAPSQERLGLIYFIDPLRPAAVSSGDHGAGTLPASLADSVLAEFFPRGVAVDQNYAEAARWNVLAAQAGVAAAQARLGHQYALGLGVERDGALAEQFFTRAAEQADIAGARGLGLLYSGAYGVGPSDPARALSWLRVAATGGDSTAQCQLGRLLLRGDGVAADGAAAVGWFERAAAQGNVDAMACLGTAYAEGRGVAPDLAVAESWLRRAAARHAAEAEFLLGRLLAERSADHAIEAAQWLRDAAEQGHSRAAALLADLHLAGRGMPRNLGEAQRWLERAGSAGEPESYTHLAWLHASAPDGDRNYDAAAKWLQEAADRGSVAALFNLGSLYRHGHGVSQDLAAAAEYYRRAADGGHVPAAFQLGLMYAGGEGMRQDHAQAARYFERAADAGHLLSRCNLALLLIEGHGIPADPARGVALLESAVAEGNGDAAEALFKLHSDGVHFPADPTRAAQFLVRAAELGSTAAMRSLADWILRGEHLPRDPRRARELLVRAASAGDVRAQTALGYFLADAEADGPPDLEGARHWFEMAAAQGDADAQAWLGDCSRLGLIDAPDPVGAEAWYRKAAAQNHAGALLVLATALEASEHRTDVVEREIFGLWLASAAAGNTLAQRKVGLCYLHGRGCEIDPEAAFPWLEAAAQAGDSEAEFEVGRCRLEGLGAQADPDAALTWFERAAAGGHEAAQAQLEAARAQRATSAGRRAPRINAARLRPVSRLVDSDYLPVHYVLPDITVLRKPPAGRIWRDRAAEGDFSRNLAPHEIAFPRIGARVVDRALLAKQVVVYDTEHLYLDSAVQLADAEAIEATTRQFSAAVRASRGDSIDERYTEDTVCVANHEGFDAWGVFVTQCLPRMLVCGMAFPDAKFVVAGGEPSITAARVAALAFCGITADRLVITQPDTVYRFGRAVLLDGLVEAASGALDPRAIDLMRSGTTAARGVPGAKRAAFLRRPAATLRQIANEAEVEAVLDRHGIAVFEQQTLTFDAQLALWRNHELLIGTLGSDLLNSVFGRAGTRILSLSPHWIDEAACFELCAAVGQGWNELRCGELVERDPDTPDFSSFNVEVDVLDEVLAALLG